MQKIKFQIKGMHCNSCAALIEEKLKNQPGIIKVRASYDSQKAIIVYDEQKIQESDIQRLISETGDYRLGKIEEAEKEDGIKKESSRVLEVRENPSRPNFLIPISIIIVGLLIGGAIIVSSGNFNIGNKIVSAKQTAQVLQDSNPNSNAPAQSSQPKGVVTFDITETSHIRGNINAPITLVEFSDFECPFCEKIYPTLNKILNDYQDKVKLVYKYFPLSFHPNAQKAAEAAECAAEQGKFWEYHDKLFTYQASGFSLDKFKQWAKDLGLNSAQFNGCLDSGKYASKVQTDFQEGQQKGVSGTPATFVNGQLVIGAQPYEVFKQIIDNLLK